MAVVQISRIQVRRGKKGTQGVPQLASGELGWAIDDQELYIGSGAVSEGAPAVENVQILTAKDNLLTLANQYAYKRGEIQTGVDATTPIQRSVQDKLDDIVSVRDFGAVGNGDDATDAIQRAVDQLYVSSSKGLYSSRIKLLIPAGEYVISSPIYVPPFATIIGEGKDKTFINSTTGMTFKTVNETSTPGTPADSATTTANNMTRQITIADLTIQQQNFGAAIYLENCKNSVIENIKITGGWSTGFTGLSDGIELGASNTELQDRDYVNNNNIVGIVINNGSIAAASSDYNKFTNLDFSGVAVAVHSHDDIKYNVFDKGTMYDVGIGFLLGSDASVGQALGSANGPYHNTITNYIFEIVGRRAVDFRRGQFNTSENNRFLNVGNEGGNEANGSYPCMRFAEKDNNSLGDYFERTNERTVGLTIDASLGTYYPEIEGYKNTVLQFINEAEIGVKLNSQPFLYLCGDATRGVVEVDYTYKAEIAPGPCIRTGTMRIAYNKDNASVAFEDDYMYDGNMSVAGGLIFTVQSFVGNNKIIVECENTTLDNLSPEEDLFTYQIRYIV